MRLPCGGGDLFDQPQNGTEGQPAPNLSEDAKSYLDALKASPEVLFYHAFAVLHAPTYRTENAGALRQDWPRIPLPESRKALEASAELGRTAGWGYVGHHGATMPGGGEKTGRSFTPDEEAALPEVGLERFGATTYDVFLNEVAYWRNVPARVWDYTLGGYPVLKKWFSYREKDVIGRGLKLEEVKHFMRMARRIAALLLLEPALDENYARSKAEETLA